MFLCSLGAHCAHFAGRPACGNRVDLCFEGRCADVQICRFCLMLDRWWYATREQGGLWLVFAFYMLMMAFFLCTAGHVHWRTAGMIWLFILAMNATTVNAGYSEAERDAMPAIIPQDSIVPRGVCTHETEAMCPILPFNKYRHQNHLLNII